MLIAGAGVIGTVYSAHLGAAGHAQPEMRALASQVTARLGNSPALSRLCELLLTAPPASR
jgi:ketopantoate reductase